MLFLTAAVVMLATSSVPIQTAFAASSTKDDNSSCNIKAWVRAEDLSPNAIVNGDLRIKVDQGCTDEIASVSLELRLDEFSEVKYLKEGATLPALPNCWRMFGAFGDPDHDRYYESLRDPALWIVKAEERTAFKSAVTLIKKFFDYSQPVIVPFTVAVPNVNYPPALRLSGHSFGDSGRETNSMHLYRYTALIAFQSGHKVEIPAGYTTFDPVHDASLHTRAFSTNVTLEERTQGLRDHLKVCAADTEETIFEAQVTVEGGNVVGAGDTMKGRVAVHRLTGGSTTAQNISIHVRSERDHRWAQAQAASADHIEAFRLSNSSFSSAIYRSEISTSDSQYDDILRRKGRRNNPWEPFSEGALTEQKQYLDFELKVSEDAVRNFHAYYATSVTSLVITLDVPYPLAQGCVFGGEDEEPIDDANHYKEGLWDDCTPIGQSHKGPGYALTQLVAEIPITLIGAQRLNPGSPPPVHYLTPGVASPVILASSPHSSYKDVVFPVSQPIITPEPTENTASRLLSPSVSGIMISMQDPLHPNRYHASIPYAGILWKKKMMTEHRARVVVPTAEEDALPYYGSSDFQVVL